MKNKTIIWAINPSEKNKGAWLHSALYLKKLAKQFGATVTPTYVLSPLSVFLPLEGYSFLPPRLHDFMDGAKKEINNILKSVKIPQAEDAKVIISDISSLKENAKSLVNYAKKRKALFIFAPTHARVGLPRFWLGSFVENLLLYSDIPVFTINPKVKLNVSISSVLYPTDLSNTSKDVFKSFLPLARVFGAKIFLFHHLKGFSEINLGQSGLSADTWGIYRKELDHIRLRKTQEIKNWKSMAERMGVDCSYEILESNKSITESILDFSKTKKIKLVALNTAAGPFESLFTGSTARQLVRYSPAPIWVVHKDNVN